MKKKTPTKRLTIVQVASRIKKPYQTTRNLMLSGECGQSKYDEEKRELTVPESGVVAYLEREAKKSEPKAAP